MATTEQGATHPPDERMDKLRISNGQIEAAPFGPALPGGAVTPTKDPDSSVKSDVLESSNGLLDPELRWRVPAYKELA